MEQKANQQRGRFIVFEGIDGAGKTTQIECLKQALSQQGRRVYCTAEPTESVTGGLLREALCGLHPRTAGELAALFVTDRIVHNVNPVNGIEKMLSDGIDVICDRYYYSSLAYQGSETDYEWVRAMNLDCPEIRRPDLCIFLDLTPLQSMERINRGRVTQEIYENAERLERVRQKFYSVFDFLKQSENIAIINAYGTVEQVHQTILERVNALQV